MEGAKGPQEKIGFISNYVLQLIFVFIWDFDRLYKNCKEKRLYNFVKFYGSFCKWRPITKIQISQATSYQSLSFGPSLFLKSRSVCVSFHLDLTTKPGIERQCFTQSDSTRTLLSNFYTIFCCRLWKTTSKLRQPITLRRPRKGIWQTLKWSQLEKRHPEIWRQPSTKINKRQPQ